MQIVLTHSHHIHTLMAMAALQYPIHARPYTTDATVGAPCGYVAEICIYSTFQFTNN